MTMEVLERERTLDELAEIANSEHEAVESDLRSAIAHAIAAGEAIHEAHERIRPSAEWQEWVRANLRFNSGGATSRYERIYVYRDRLPAEAFQPFTDSRGRLHQPTAKHVASTYLIGLPPIRNKNIGLPHMQTEAKRLRSEGMRVGQIAEMLGVSRKSVGVWIGTEKINRARNARYLRERREARRALARERDSAAIRCHGGSLATVYADIRRSLQILDQHVASSESPALRRRLNAVIADLHAAEDHLVRTLRLGEMETA